MVVCRCGMITTVKLSKREKEILDKIVETDSIKTAASYLKITVGTVYNVLYRLRKKQQEARKFINQVLAYRKKPVLNRVLAPKLTSEDMRRLAEKVEEQETKQWVSSMRLNFRYALKYMVSVQTKS